MIQDSSARCFGQRMLSPFRGIMHCIVNDSADAVTTDGRVWTLYVRGECLYDDPPDLDRRQVTIPDVKYGQWSATRGFRRAPIRLPTFDARVREEGDRLLQAVQDQVDSLPFPLADRFELWLLHAGTGRPLAMIASCCDAEECELPALVRWTPGQLCIAELEEARQLARIIGELAGKPSQAQWFERHADGSGSPRSGTFGDQHAVQQDDLPAACFDPLFVDPNALTAPQLRLLRAVLDWQSPALLQLPDLTPTQRAEFETAACRHALRLAEQLPLYPCILDGAAITAALVEARLRHSNATPTASGDGKGPLSPYYLEIPES